MIRWIQNAALALKLALAGRLAGRLLDLVGLA